MSDEQTGSSGTVDSARVAEWLNKRWKGNKRCPICEENNWRLPDGLAGSLSFEEPNVMTLEVVYPMLLVTCNVCGHVLAFNAKVMGLVEGCGESDAEVMEHE